jgi:hypothetical protein
VLGPKPVEQRVGPLRGGVVGLADLTDQPGADAVQRGERGVDPVDGV